MGRIRTVKPDWLDDELLAMAPSDARVLSVGLILLADDYGNGRASRVLLGSRVFPGQPYEVIDAALAYLVDVVRYVRLYEVDGQRYFSIRTWAKHQRVDHPGKPQVPSPPEDGKKPRRVSRKSRDGLGSTPESLSSDGESLAPRAIPSDPIPSSPIPEGDPGESRETVCPLDLVERVERAGIPEQFAKTYGVSVEAVRYQVRETRTYWTIGGGSGRRKRNWLATVRTRLHELGKARGLVMPANEPEPIDRDKIRADKERAERGAVEAQRRKLAAQETPDIASAKAALTELRGAP